MKGGLLHPTSLQQPRHTWYLHSPKVEETACACSFHSHRPVTRSCHAATVIPSLLSTPPQAWTAVRHWPSAPIAATLTQLQLRSTGASELQLPSEWLLGLPRLRRLSFGNAISLDLSELPEAITGQAVATSGHIGAAAPAAAPAVAAALPPLEHLELNQAAVDEFGWRGLASGALLGGSLTSLQLSRCGLPSADTLRWSVTSWAASLEGAASAGMLQQQGAIGGSAAAAGISAVRGFSAQAVPFLALRKLVVGVPDQIDSLVAVAQLPALHDLTCYHLHCGDGGFGPEAPLRLTTLTNLTRLVMVPVVHDWVCSKTADDLRPLFPQIVEYEGPKVVMGSQQT